MRCYSCNNPHNTELDEQTGRFYCPKCYGNIFETIVEDSPDDDIVDNSFDTGVPLWYNKGGG